MFLLEKYRNKYKKLNFFCFLQKFFCTICCQYVFWWEKICLFGFCFVKVVTSRFCSFLYLSSLICLLISCKRRLANPGIEATPPHKTKLRARFFLSSIGDSNKHSRTRKNAYFCTFLLKIVHKSIERIGIKKVAT